MKLCQTCEQHLAETMTICPSCGDEVGKGRQMIDDYRIISVISEGHASILCRVEKEGDATPYLIRLFKDQARITEEVAARLQQRINHLNQLSDEGFIKHFEIKRSHDELWYRVSEWVDSEDWSRVFASGMLKDFQVAFDLFHQMATSLTALHETGHFIPHLVLNDIVVVRENDDSLKVKIDYKLSRFLNQDPKIPGTMLSDLLQCHPDIVNNKPLDFRSDIWSLGKIFLQLLTADLSGCPSMAEISQLKIPKNAKTLLKIMLAEDPSLRPQSMKEVAENLAAIIKEGTKKAKYTSGRKHESQNQELQQLRKRIWALASFLIVLVFGVFGGLTYFGVFEKDIEAQFQEYANHYSNSVAFVLVEYSLVQDDVTVYRKRTEGTAFLVDSEGYLITNRHVAAPWLLDRDLFIVIEQMKRQLLDVEFKSKMYLWFEGSKAYRRLSLEDDAATLSDIYFLESAYRSDGKPRVEVAGIERSLVRQGYLANSPLKDDFAVLRISSVPEGLEPIPLDESLQLNQIKKLSPVITIGFPLGSRAQANRVNVSVTKGNVRRTFEDMIQVDTSIYKGNSGGPLIDINGKAIGIATGIMFDTTTGMVPVMTPLSDIGMVLPITKTVRFLKELKAGQPKWNGKLDLSINKKVEKIKALAIEGNWELAMEQADATLRFSLDPTLITTAGMMHFCNGDYTGARWFFERVISMDAEHQEIRFMLYLIDWLAGDYVNSPHRKFLIPADWRSSAELYGYLTRLLEGKVDPVDALSDWYNIKEMVWIYYISALMHSGQSQAEDLNTLLTFAINGARKNDWNFFLVLAELNKLQEQRLLLSRGKEQKDELKGEISSFYDTLRAMQISRDEKMNELIPLFSRFMQPSVGISEKVMILDRMKEIEPGNRDTLVSLAYFSAMEGNWADTLKYVTELLEKGVRKNKTYFSMRLLELGALKRQSPSQELISQKLAALEKGIPDPWFKEIVQHLDSRKSDAYLRERAKLVPEDLLLANFAMAFWAESEGNLEKAVGYYKDALATYLEGWWEYEFSKARIKKLQTIMAEISASE